MAGPVYSLLPPNATALERALEAAMAARVEAITAPLRSLWNADTCPAPWLPALAWQLSIDEWRAEWALVYKRDMVRTAIRDHRIKGTRASILGALARAGYGDATITEAPSNWYYGDDSVAYGQTDIVYGAGSDWAIYDIAFDRPLTLAQIASVRRILYRTVPARCHLRNLTVQTIAWVYGDPVAYGDLNLSYY